MPFNMPDPFKKRLGFESSTSSAASTGRVLRDQGGASYESWAPAARPEHSVTSWTPQHGEVEAGSYYSATLPSPPERLVAGIPESVLWPMRNKRIAELVRRGVIADPNYALRSDGQVGAGRIGANRMGLDASDFLPSMETPLPIQEALQPGMAQGSMTLLSMELDPDGSAAVADALLRGEIGGASAVVGSFGTGPSMRMGEN